MNELQKEMYEIIDVAYEVDLALPEEQQRFRIQDDQAAIWALRKINQAESECSQAVAVAEAEIGRIKEWLERKQRERERTVSFFKSLLSDYMIQLKEKNPKLKTYPLPGGKLKMRKQQDSFIVDDQDLVLTWAKENCPEAVKVAESVLVSPLKEYYAETGEVIPGLTVMSRPDKFDIELEG